MSERREREGVDLRWLIVPVILAVVMTLAVGLNIAYTIDSAARLATALKVDNGDLKIDWNRYPTYDIELGEPVVIKKPGTYRLTGELKTGGVELDIVNTEARLILDNATIINPHGPAIYCGEGEDVVIELVGENYVEDSAKYEGDYDERTNGAIYINADLTLRGEGTLTVVGNYADGIVGKDDLKITSGRYNIRAKDDGIRGTDSMQITGGEFKIRAKKDGLKTTKGDKGIQKGFVLITGGEFDIDVSGKGIEAINTALIRGGRLNIKSYEGIEARTVAIDGGEIKIAAVDDGLNAKSDTGESCLIMIDGGDIYIDASGDGIDANGRMVMTGGRVIIDGPISQKNSALDADENITIKGGELMAVGASAEAQIPELKTTTVPVVSKYFAVAVNPNSQVEVKSELSETVFIYNNAKRFNHLVFASDKLLPGVVYNIYINGRLAETYEK